MTSAEEIEISAACYGGRGRWSGSAARPVTIPTDLLIKLSKKIDEGRGVRLTADELDALVISGAYETFSRYCAEGIAQQARD